MMRYLAKVLLLVGAYVAAGSLGQFLAIPPGNVTLVWPPSGIALAALLLGGWRLWPGIWLGAFLVNVRTLFDPGLSPSIAVSLTAGAAIATGSAVQALVGRRLIADLAEGRGFLDRARGVFRFTVGAMMMCLIGSSVGATSLAMAGFTPWGEHGFVWRTWWLGDLAGVLVFTPLLVVWLRRPRARWDLGRLAEAAAFAGLLSATTLAIFAGWLPAEVSASYPTFPVLMWAAFRFGRHGTTAAICFVAAMASWGTGRGDGPFQGGTLQQRLYLLQVYISVLAFSTLTLAAVVEERLRAAGALEELNRTLESQVAERSAVAVKRAERLAKAEEDCRRQARTFRSILDNILEGIVVADAWGEVVLWNPAAEELIGRGPLDVGPDQWSSRYGCFLPDQVTPYPVDRLPLMRVLRGEVVLGEEMFLRNPSRPDGIWLRITGVPLRHGAEEMLGGVVVLRDITEHRQASDLLKSAVELSPDGTIMVDRAGRIVLVNQETERMFGYAREELLGQPLGTLVPERARARHEELVRQFVVERRRRSMNRGLDLFARRKDGSEFPVDIALHSCELNGEDFAVATIRDMTERRRLMEAVEIQVQVQDAIGQVLRNSLEPMGVEEQLRRALDAILSVPWFAGPARGEILLVGGGDGPLVVEARRGLPPGDPSRCDPTRSDHCLCGRAPRHREVVFAGGPDGGEGCRHPGQPRWSHYCVPIRNGEHYGVIRVFVDEPHPRRPEEEEFLSSVARILAGTIERKRAEEALRASERQYRAVYDQAAVGIAEEDLTGRFLRANDRYCEIVGYPRDELLRLRFQDITHPEDQPAHRGQFARIAEGPSSYTIEKRYVRRDGRLVWVRAAISLIRDAAGRPERVAAVVEDITERVRAEEDLRQSEARFRAISEAAPLGIFRTDAAGDYLYTNPAYFELTGRSTEEVLGQGWNEVIHPEDRDRVLAAWYQAARDRSPFELTYRLLHRGGRTIWVSTRSAEIRVDNGLTGYVGIVEDITQRRAAIEALRRSEERFDLAVRGTDAGIWDWDLRTGALYFSPRWKSMLGYAEDEIGDRFSEWESRFHPEDRERALEAVRAYLEGRAAEYEMEHRLRHKDGSYRWILARGAAVRDDEGRPYRMVGSQIDVTVYKQTAEQLSDSLIQFRAAQKIQQALLPRQSPSITGLDLAGSSVPAAYAGGDLFDYVPMLGGNLGIVVGDVSGHGIGAALQMASTRAFVRSLAQTCATVGEVMTRINRFVFDETEGDSFVTMLLIRMDPRTRSLTYANAGHPPGYVLDPAGNVRAELGSSALPLGIVEQYDFPVAESVVLRPGELVVLVTDGILEARSPAEAYFGSERLLEVVRNARDRPAHEILEELHRAVGRHAATPALEDDVTAVIIKVGRGEP